MGGVLAARRTVAARQGGLCLVQSRRWRLSEWEVTSVVVVNRQDKGWELEWRSLMGLPLGRARAGPLATSWGPADQWGGCAVLGSFQCLARRQTGNKR